MKKHLILPAAILLSLGISQAETQQATSSQSGCCAAKKADASACDKNYLMAEYPAMLDPATLGKQLAIGDGYSRYQGVTGVLLPKGENTIIVKGLGEGLFAAILVPDWLRKPEDEKNPSKDPNGWGLKRIAYPITEGTNTINIEKEGLAYVHYYSVDPDKLPPISIHFVDGIANGYFDISKHNDKDWDKLLANAKYPIMDALGKHIQVAYPVADLQNYAAGRGVELINLYDGMMQTQYDIMGLTKYNRIPQNKMLARVNYNYFMFRDGDGVAYMGGPRGNAMKAVIQPDQARKASWGFNHEVGHAHQLTPEFRWGGLTEVSNNVMSLYGTMALGEESRLKAKNNYAKARKNIIEAGESYLKAGVFERLVPFWQLQLYFTEQGYKDFYPDLYEALRQQHAGNIPELPAQKSKNPAVHQLNFVKQVCRVGKTDMTDFFEKYGFFVVGEWEVKDYGTFQYKMTPEMVKECKEAIAAMNLPKPKGDPSTLEDKN